MSKALTSPREENGGGGFSLFSTFKGLNALLFREEIAEEEPVEEEVVDEWEQKRLSDLESIEKRLADPKLDIVARRALMDAKSLKEKGRGERKNFWKERQNMLKEEHLTAAPHRRREKPKEAPPFDPDSLLTEDMLEYRRQNESLLKLIGNRPPKELPPGLEVFENPFDPMDATVVKAHRLEKRIANKALPKVVNVKGEMRNAPARPYTNQVAITSFSGNILPSYHEEILR